MFKKVYIIIFIHFINITSLVNEKVPGFSIVQLFKVQELLRFKNSLSRDIVKYKIKQNIRIQFALDNLNDNTIENIILKKCKYIFTKQTIRYIIQFVKQFKLYCDSKLYDRKRYLLVLKIKVNHNTLHNKQIIPTFSHVDTTVVYHSIVTLFGYGTLYFPSTTLDDSSKTHSCYVSTHANSIVHTPIGYISNSSQFLHTKYKPICHEAPIIDNRVALIQFV